MEKKKGTDLEKNIKIQLIYLLSKHTYIQRLKSSFFTRTQLQRFKLISKLFYLFRIFISQVMLLPDIFYKVDIPSVYDKEVLTPNLLFDRHN